MILNIYFILAAPHFGDVWMYNIGTGKWELRKAHSNENDFLIHSGSALTGTQVFVFGGADFSMFEILVTLCFILTKNIKEKKKWEQLQLCHPMEQIFTWVFLPIQVILCIQNYSMTVTALLVQEQYQGLLCSLILLELNCIFSMVVLFLLLQV